MATRATIRVASQIKKFDEARVLIGVLRSRKRVHRSWKAATLIRIMRAANPRVSDRAARKQFRRLEEIQDSAGNPLAYFPDRAQKVDFSAEFVKFIILDALRLVRKRSTS